MKTLKDDLQTVNELNSQLYITDLCAKLGITTTAGKRFVDYALANALLFERKQLDYGSKNIAKHGTHGVIVRMDDKFERLANLYSKSRRRKALNESIMDTFRDVSNYAVIASMLERGEWPNE